MRILLIAFAATAIPAAAFAADPTPAAPVTPPAMKGKSITMHDGIECHYEAPIGSLIQKKVCTTKQVRDQSKRDAEEMILNRASLPSNN